MKFDEIAGRIGDERLTTRPHRSRIAHFHAPAPQLGHGVIEIVHEQGEVLAETSRRLPLDQVDLLVPGVEPGPAEGKVGPIAPPLEPEDVAIEPHARLDVVDIDGHVMNRNWSHPTILSIQRPSCPKLRLLRRRTQCACGKLAVAATRREGFG